MTTTTTSTPEAHATRTRAQDLVAQMTQDEKFAWLSGPMAIPLSDDLKAQGAIGSAAFYPGIPRLGIPAMQQADASLGISNIGDVRPGDHATGLPSSLLLGATFNPQLAFDGGALVGREARAKGFNVQLAGGANLIREPRGGRNFEYIAEDPLLTGLLAGYAVAGIQAQGIVSTVKHFIANSQETGRVMVSSNLSEAAMRESDLLAFQIAIEIGKPGAVMPGYNLVNGDYASENAFLLQQVLKQDWGYAGWVMSDWYPGSGGGPAVAGVLFGRVNPSGRLPVTFPASEAQLPRPEQIDPETTTSNPGMPRKGDIIPIDHDVEGSDVGYRWFEREGLTPLFPFGFGRSYTTFALSDLRVTVDGEMNASVQVSNSGNRPGALVVQIYVSKMGEDGFVKRLAGFVKVTLAAGQTSFAEIALEPRIVARYRTGAAPGFVIGEGTYRVWAAHHACDDALWQDVVIAP